MKNALGAGNQASALYPLVAAFGQVRDQAAAPAAELGLVGGEGGEVVHFGRVGLQVEQLRFAVARVVDVLPTAVGDHGWVWHGEE